VSAERAVSGPPEPASLRVDAQGIRHVGLADDQPAPLRDLLGAPGLWRSAGGERVFELAPALREMPADEDPGWWDETARVGDPDADLLAWAEATAGGAFGGPVAPPAADDLAAWLPAPGRYVRAGAQVRPVEVVAGPERVALLVRVLVALPPGLPAAREAWLETLCRDAQQRWRLVRFGVDDGQACVRAEVDLTGAPPGRAHVLYPLALAALIESASWVLPALAHVTDLSAASRLLERAPSHDDSDPQPSDPDETRGEAR